MALPTLSDEQVRTLSRSQKDHWWLEHVFRGDMPQLTIRSALTGFLLGGVLAATSLYIGAKTGISIGVGLTSVLITFALFRLLEKTPMGGGFTILENNCTQSITTAAGYVVTPLTTSFAAYMLVTGRILPAWQMILWTIVISILGVLVAFPLKRRFINEEQLPFPEGRACGVVLDALYTGSAEAGLFKTRLLTITTGLTAFLQLIMSDGWMKLLQFGVFRMDRWTGLREPWHLHERLDTYYYTWAAKASGAIPRILGTDIRQLGLRFTVDAALMGVGGLIGTALVVVCRGAGFRIPRSVDGQCLLWRALVGGVPVAAAHSRTVDHLHQLHGVDLVDPHRRALENYPVHHRFAGSLQSGQQFDSGRNDGRGGFERGEPALRHQARLHAGSQTPPTGHRSCDRHRGGCARGHPVVLPAVPAAQCVWRSLHGHAGHRAVCHAGGRPVERCG